MKFGGFSVIELALIFTVFGAFLAFFGLYLMLRKRKRHCRKRKFARKQLVMEEALNNKMKAKRKMGSWENNEDIRARERKHERELLGENEWPEDKLWRNARQSDMEKKEPAIQAKKEKTQKPEKSIKGSEKMEQMFMENRRISHRRDQLKQMEEGAAAK